MGRYKKYFYTLIAINSLLPVFFILLRGAHRESWVVLIVAVVIAIVCGAVFLISWLLYFVFTGGKEPAGKFHLFPQIAITLLILSFFGYHTYSDWYYSNYQENIDYNRDFLESGGFEGYRDTLSLKTFHLLEDKIGDKNEIRLQQWSYLDVDTVINNIREPVRFVYFTYTLKDDPKKLASKHMVSNHINQMLLHNVPIDFLPDLKNTQAKNLAKKESTLLQLLEYYNHQPADKKDKEAIKLVKMELEKIKAGKN
ncbi:hypothetical protein [Ferruginibacter profundus]